MSTSGDGSSQKRESTLTLVHELAATLVDHGAVPLAERWHSDAASLDVRAPSQTSGNDGSSSLGPIIAVVGAGCSSPARIPGAWELKRRLQEVIGKKISLNVLDNELRRTLASGHSLDEATLEEFTQVGCKYLAVRDVVVDELKRQCRLPAEGFVHPPLAGYELLAHMVKHGLIDHIISFNFDEFLDESLHNELGSALRRIISERDTLLTETLPPNMSCLIKPHGTISSLRSLRFTREDVATFPDELATYI
ncbi:MAG: hypothetical protein QOJ29_3880, partial [Thermoleophilaceae bacterium]|nr:hypothetical protein [Thermoleophilaceae bacterium]